MVSPISVMSELADYLEGFLGMLLVTGLLVHLFEQGVEMTQTTYPSNPVGDGQNCPQCGNSDDYRELGNAELLQKLRDHQQPESVLNLFEEQTIRGEDLQFIRLGHLMGNGLSYSDCLTLQPVLEQHKLWETEDPTPLKIFNDPVHGNIELPHACIAIIDTPEFRRLRDIKQSGMVYHVYPGAAHNKFEHCLGVCHLAGELARALKKNDRTLELDEKDILCLQIGGLCYDLGAGPFSHVFSDRVIPKIKGPQFRVQDISLKMFRHLIKINKLMEPNGKLRNCGVTDEDIVFIEELIGGPSKRGERVWPYASRVRSKAFLFEIITNQRNSVDVKKWDSIARDCHQLGIFSNFDHSRFITFARALEVNGEKQICIRKDELVNMYSLFSTRYFVNKMAHRHRVTGAMELMISQALLKAKDADLIKKADGSLCSIADCIEDMKGLTELTDQVIVKIRESECGNKDMRKAKEIIDKFYRRELFKCVVQSEPMSMSSQVVDENKPDSGISFTGLGIAKDHAKIESEICEFAKKRDQNVKWDSDAILVEIVDLDYGMKDENPVQNLHIYTADNPTEGLSLSMEEAPLKAPSNTRESQILVYISDRSSGRTVKEAYNEWFEKKKKDAEASRANDNMDNNSSDNEPTSSNMNPGQ